MADRVPPSADPSRRALLGGGAALLAAGPLAACAPKPAAGGTFKVSTYGGNFEQAMGEHLYPVFEKASGIKVESLPQTAGLQFLLQLIQANKAGLAPLDLCICGGQDIQRGRNAGIWRIRDPRPLTNLGNLPDHYIARSDKGIDGVGALGWYLALVVNTEKIATAPDSWTALWDPAHRDAWGLNGSASLLYEITAATYFGGIGILETEAGILQVLAKIAELKPNTRLWWESEGVMQTALENGEVQGGVYFADVAATMAAAGTPVKTIFPREGAVIDFGCWCQPTASTKVREADEFINFMCSAEAQELVARHMNAPPLAKTELLNLTREELARVSGGGAPINVNLKARAAHLDFMSTRFNQMVAS
jgi:putative spermidine/putrescine transport system substrate-binding protein